MPAPTAKNGWERAIKIIGIPSFGILFAVAITLKLHGSIAAGLVLNVATLITLLGVAAGATFWPAVYTGMIAIGGTFLFFITPSIMSQLVHPALSAVNQLFVLGFLGYIWLVFLGKLGFVEPRK
ncbi:hypothetical protein [Halolamina rubra]|uniref:hypothetical protein n=1 Tax=Halolamina rubra TaxID=1380430 RepID=UPI0012ABA254|nr:hypothetical protein [Halolamina rubra]